MSEEYTMIIVDETNDMVKFLYDDKYHWLRRKEIYFEGAVGDTVKVDIPDELAEKKGIV